MKFILGNDGGRTKTKYVLKDEGMNKMNEITGEASNLFAVGISKSSLVLSDLTKLVNRSSEIKEIKYQAEFNAALIVKNS